MKKSTYESLAQSDKEMKNIGEESKSNDNELLKDFNKNPLTAQGFRSFADVIANDYREII
jgi:hypothetical protein